MWPQSPQVTTAMGLLLICSCICANMILVLSVRGRLLSSPWPMLATSARAFHLQQFCISVFYHVAHATGTVRFLSQPYGDHQPFVLPGRLGLGNPRRGRPTRINLPGFLSFPPYLVFSEFDSDYVVGLHRPVSCR